MKRYWLFLGEMYYPGGGALDLHGQYDTVQEAIWALGRAEVNPYGTKGFASDFPDDIWWHIYDTQKGEIAVKHPSDLDADGAPSIRREEKAE